jgi:chemotaxis protein CheZ
VPDHILESGDSPDLEALFDSIASQQKKPPNSPAAQSASTPQASNEVMYEQIGQITRKMHNALRDWATTSRWKRWQMPFRMHATA